MKLRLGGAPVGGDGTGVAIKLFPDEVSEDRKPDRIPENRKKEAAMSKKIGSKLKSTKKWLGKDSLAALNIKPAQSALASAEKAATDLADLKAKLAAASAAKKAAIKNLEDSLDTVKAEKKLKKKEARIQAKLAALGTARA